MTYRKRFAGVLLAALGLMAIFMPGIEHRTAAQQTALPDLMITSVELITPNPTVGDTIVFLAKVENRGQAPVETFDIELVGEQGGKDRKTVGALAVNGATDVALKATVGAENELFTVTVDPDQKIAESNEENNQLQVPVQARAQSQPPTAPPATGPEQLFWNFGDVNVSVAQICIFGICLNIGTIDAVQPFPFDLASAVDRLGIQSAQQTQSMLPKDVTFTLDFASKTGKLAGPAPSSSTGAQAMFDLFDGRGKVVAVLTVTFNIILQGGSMPPGPGPVPGPTVTLTIRATLGAQNINGVPIATSAGTVRTPGALSLPLGASITLTAPGTISISGVGTKTFQHWVHCMGISCLVIPGRTLNLTNLTMNSEARAVYGP